MVCFRLFVSHSRIYFDRTSAVLLLCSFSYLIDGIELNWTTAILSVFHDDWLREKEHLENASVTGNWRRMCGVTLTPKYVKCGSSTWRLDEQCEGVEEEVIQSNKLVSPLKLLRFTTVPSKNSVTRRHLVVTLVVAEPTLNLLLLCNKSHPLQVKKGAQIIGLIWEIWIHQSLGPGKFIGCRLFRISFSICYGKEICAWNCLEFVRRKSCK